MRRIWIYWLHYLRNLFHLVCEMLLFEIKIYRFSILHFCQSLYFDSWEFYHFFCLTLSLQLTRLWLRDERNIDVHWSVLSVPPQLGSRCLHYSDFSVYPVKNRVYCHFHVTIIMIIGPSMIKLTLYFWYFNFVRGPSLKRGGWIFLRGHKLMVFKSSIFLTMMQSWKDPFY